MEFYQKLQELRKSKGITQEELAKKLYVSRTAVSKWESNRGYPNLESLKDIAKFFSVSVDELLSSNELLNIAEKDQTETKNNFKSLVFSLLDLSVLLLLFLPFFAERELGVIKSVSLINLYGVELYLKILYYIFIALTVLIGIFMLVFQNCQTIYWIKSKYLISLSLGAILTILFMISLQPYASVFSFALLLAKVLLYIKY